MDRPAPSLAPGRPALSGADGPLRSAAFGDIYFSPEDGLAESEAVFLAGCGLPDAWANRRRFVVGELGFGTGLNILALMRLWRRTRPGGATLHVVSVEGFPLRRADAARALAAFPEIADVAKPLLEVWPPRIRGVHRRRLPDGVFLTLAHLDVADALAALDFSADAWFLDGFAPAKNPDMWSPEICAAIAARSAPGARLATFTVAGGVRRGLEAAGFAVEKKPGYGRKRERLEATWRGPAPISPASPLYPRAPAPGGPVLILGAGIAGASAAQALRARGVDVALLDAAPGPAQGASGMAASLVTPRLDLDDAPTARFHRTAYAEALATYAGSPAYRAIGVVRAGKDADESARLRRVLESEALPPDMAYAVDAADAGGPPGFALLLPQAGLLSPRGWIETALAGVRRRWSARVQRLERAGGGWIARGADGGVLAEGAACIVALGAAASELPQLAALTIRPSRGQVSIASLAGEPPHHALLWGSYAAPLADGRLLFGATHESVEATSEPPLPCAADDDRNVAALAAFAPTLAARLDRSRMEARAGVRATTPDRLPYVGAAPDGEAYRRRFAGLAAGRVDPGPPGPMHEGLYVLGGLGGRGFASAPALAEALASEMLGEPGALEIAAAAALHPARMLARDLKRRTPARAPV